MEPWGEANTMFFGVNKREDILLAGLKLFSARGFENITLSEIQANAGVSIATFYRHFRSKEQLVNEIYRDLRRLLETKLAAALIEGESARAQFRKLWVQMMVFHREYPGVIDFLENRHHGAYLDEHSRALEHLPQPIVALMENMSRDRAARSVSPIVLAALVWGAFVELIRLRSQEYLSLSEVELKAAEECTWDAIRAVSSESEGVIASVTPQPA
jgi:AcrR family transcriptional regulator